MLAAATSMNHARFARRKSELVVGGSIIVAGLPIAGIFGRLKLKPKGKLARA
jgi:hypothetical protein